MSNPEYTQLSYLKRELFCMSSDGVGIPVTEGTELDIVGSIDFDALPIDCIIGEFHYGKTNKHSFNSFLSSKGFKIIEVDHKHFLATKI